MDPYRDASVDDTAARLLPDELARLRRQRRRAWRWALLGWLVYFVPVAALSPIVVLPIVLASHYWGAWIGESIFGLFLALVAWLHVRSSARTLAALDADLAGGRAEVVLEQRRRVHDSPPGLYRQRRLRHSGEILGDELVLAANESSDDPTALERQQDDLDRALGVDAATLAANAAGRLTRAQRRRARARAWGPSLIGLFALGFALLVWLPTSGFARLLVLVPLAVVYLEAGDALKSWRDALGGVATAVEGHVDKHRLYVGHGNSAYFLRLGGGAHELSRDASDALVLLDVPYRVYCARSSGVVLAIEPVAAANSPAAVTARSRP